MLIQINDQYRITSDTYNIIIEEARKTTERSKNPGEERWVQISFHSTLDNAAKWLLDRGVRTSEAKTLNELIQAITTSREEIVNALKRTS